MKVSGTATLHATPERVYAALNDPGVLVRTIPGCEQLEAVGPDRYRMTVTAGIASIKGSYLGDVTLTDPSPPSAFTLRAAGSGTPGTVRADVQVRLASGEGGTTLLSYDADAVVGGPVGGVGQRVLAGVARRTAGEFFAAVDALLTAGDLDNPPEAPAGPAGTGPAGTGPAGQRIFTRPAAVSGTATTAAWPRVDVRSQLAGAAVGAAIALAGVWLGFRLARRGG